MSHTQPTGKSISNRFAEVWVQLNHNQRRFVVAMLDATNKKEAAEAIGITSDTVYRWPPSVDEAITLLGRDIRNAVVEIISSGAAKAALIKLAGLDSDNEQTRQNVASEILDRLLGKAISHMDVKSGGKPVELALLRLAGEVVEMTEDEFTHFAGALPDFEAGSTFSSQAEEQG